MELQEFIEDSLFSIISGVRKTNEKTKSGDFAMLELNSADKISFDIAVSTEKNKTKGVSAGIKVISVSINGGANSELVNQNVSRIKFDIRPKGHIH